AWRCFCFAGGGSLRFCFGQQLIVQLNGVDEDPSEVLSVALLLARALLGALLINKNLALSSVRQHTGIHLGSFQKRAAQLRILAIHNHEDPLEDIGVTGLGTDKIDVHETAGLELVLPTTGFNYGVHVCLRDLKFAWRLPLLATSPAWLACCLLENPRLA